MDAAEGFGDGQRRPSRVSLGLHMRLAHFSDLHLLSLDGVGWLDFANKRWIGAMNLLSNRSRHYVTDAFDDMIVDLNLGGAASQAELAAGLVDGDDRVDHIVCTGDVTNLAFEQEFRFARARFDQLALGTRGVTVLPGNHDAYVSEGAEHFSSIFGPYFESDAEWQWPGADSDPSRDAAWPIVRVRGDLALIGISTSLATPWFTAYGRVGARQLERLRSVLTDPRLRGKTRVVAIHHPPAGRRAYSTLRGLRDHADFASVIATAGAEMVLHGHEHRNMYEVLRGPSGEQIPVLGVPSGTYAASDATRTARYRVIEIEVGRVISHHLRVWHRETKRFVRDESPPLAPPANAPLQLAHA